jgi:glutamate formiminotransferase/formiminotetrahydrofolate cyclodeaminase
LKAVKAIGWYIEEYGICQISMNLTDISVTPLHVAFDEVCRKAEERGLRVTGSELVGLVPLRSMLDAGRHYLKKQGRSTGVSDAELLDIAVRSMGLSELKPFDPNERIIEYKLRDPKQKLLVDRSVRAFADETASESPAPGGGSIAATVGALGAALGCMVANLTAGKRGNDAKVEEFSRYAERAKCCQMELLSLVDEDTQAFNAVMAAFALAKGTPEEVAARKAAIQAATKLAIDVPFRTMKAAYDSFAVLKAMAKDGNPNSITDAGVGALCARAAVNGAWLNVRVNAKGLDDAFARENFLQDGAVLVEAAAAAEREVLALVEAQLVKAK